MVRTFALLTMLVACSDDSLDPSEFEEAEAAITTTSEIPVDGECTHITAMRLADFHVTEYRGELAGASFKVPKGEHRVSAVAYRMPCSVEPAEPPWVTDDQLVTFAPGRNTLPLTFKANANVDVDPMFEDDAALIVRAGTYRRTGRNGEDTAGPNFALDGWNVSRITVPSIGGGGTATETLLFSIENKSLLPYSPRGMAALPDGTFVFQVSESTAAMVAFDGAGNFLDELAIEYPADTLVPTFSDGLDAVDATHLVRTAWFDPAVNCGPDGETGCQNAAIEVLEIVPGRHLRAVQQMFLPAPLHDDYPLAVAPLAGGYAVSTLPGEGGSTLTILSADGSVVSGPTVLAGPNGPEGLFDAGDGRIGAMDYEGHLTMFGGDAQPRGGETATYPIGIALSLPQSIAWSPATSEYIVLANRRLARVPLAFDSQTPLAIDLSAYSNPLAVDVRADANQVLVADLLPPIDPATNVRTPTVDCYDLASSALVTSIRLGGVSRPNRVVSVAYLASQQRIVSVYRRPAGIVDVTLDARAFVHDLAGAVVATIDLAPYGFVKIRAASYDATADELVFHAIDQDGVARLVVTSATGEPRRSYRTPMTVADIAPITSGPAAGDLGIVNGQPSEYVRVALPR